MYPYGSIVIVSQLLDPQGRNPKDRRCIVLTLDSESSGQNLTIEVVPISSRFDEPLAPELVLLPWQPPFHPKTKLIKPSVAVCNWIVEIDASQVIDQRGFIPGKVMAKIARVILSLRGG